MDVIRSKVLYGGDADEEEAWRVGEGESQDSGSSHKDLKPDRLAHELGVSAHRLSLRLPNIEMYETGKQLRRAAKSVSANLVEGYGRRRCQAEHLRFLIFAKGSLLETKEHLRDISGRGPKLEGTETLIRAAGSLGRRLFCFLALVAATHRG